jgi:hypothetical protein
MGPPSGHERDGKERPSWREIDRRRDRSRHTGRGARSEKEKQLRSTWAKKAYLKQADKFFQGKKGDTDHERAREGIHRHYGSKHFASSVRKYLKAYGLPTDWDTLLLVLDFEEEQVKMEAVEALREMAAQRSAAERQRLKDKLEILTMRRASARILSLAEGVLREL